ncbi:LysR family transcriptional regulator [Mitsuaria sp. GD03876]|uniref:LysR family transcriptional regulator n=1 Tax=Mitsuaria sp. GD03876 TaxID=2975399 RepID=UPI002446C229|nr:LysR family transcriptional regulator [Mitsuaria sp. GD03876]MDH0867566.1 LysR family transcriptional regulator [Mitsuaria sp. GD03876]
MRLKHIEVFHAVMLTGSVSAASKLLHVTQPAVTQALQLAELQLGYPLFTRQSRRLVPTREAQALYPEVQALMSQLESVRRMATALRGGEGQDFRILVVPSLAVKALPRALQLFRRRHKALPISVRTMHSNDIARAMALQEGDVGIVYGRAPHPALTDELVGTGRLVCATPRGKGAADRRATVALQDLLREPFIRIDERDPLGAVLADQWARLGLTPRAGITVQTHHIAMVMAEQGFGPAIIDSFTAQASGAELHIRALLPEVPVEVRALQPRGERSPQAVSDFIAAFRQAIEA